MFDVGGGIGVIQVDGGEAKSIQETVGGASGRLFEAVDAEFDADGRLFVEGPQSVKMIIQNDRSGHTSQAKHLYRLVLTPFERQEVGGESVDQSRGRLLSEIEKERDREKRGKTDLPSSIISWQMLAMKARAPVTFSLGTPCSAWLRNLTVVSLMTFIMGVG